jgi:hypothetical protein
LGLAGEAFHRGVYDFLKDFQSAIIGAVPFGTAIWAAKPVFGQLQAARRQAAMVAYEALAEIQASLIAEQVLFDDIRLVIKTASGTVAAQRSELGAVQPESRQKIANSTPGEHRFSSGCNCRQIHRRAAARRNTMHGWLSEPKKRRDRRLSSSLSSRYRSSSG